MSKKHRRRRPTPRVQRTWSGWSSIERATLISVLCLTIWGIVQVWSLYPSAFFPRFADEAVYAFDVYDPGTVFTEYDKSLIRYAPAKLGYGLPLAASSWLDRQNGPMYLSTLFWVLTVLTVGVLVFRRLGVLAASIATAIVSFSPMFGKYVADVGPTTEVAFAFILLWAACFQRRFWLSGLCIGFIAFIDFKWAVPAGAAFAAVEFIVERRRPLADRLRQIVLAGIVAISVIVLAIVWHPPYADFLYGYVSSHGKLMGFEPSLVFIYYLFLFGTLPVVIATVGAYTLPTIRHRIEALSPDAHRAVLHALVIAAVPILLHSLIGVHKALRFFAVVFPLLVIPVTAVLVAAIQAAGHTTAKAKPAARRLIRYGLAAMIALVIWGGSDGPAYHLSLPAGYEAALDQLRQTETASGTVSSYNYTVVTYGWYATGREPSFAYLGLHDSDRWLLLDPMSDRVTVTLRTRLAGINRDADSVWLEQRGPLLSVADSMFSVPSTYHASDYYLSEVVTDGISTLRHWHTVRSNGNNWMTMYSIDNEKFSSYKEALR